MLKTNKGSSSYLILLLDAIKQVLTIVKFSTCKDDKLTLKPIKDILRLRLQIEGVNDTERVQEYPKRITVYVLSNKSSLLFETIKIIKNLTYLRMLLHKLVDLELITH